MSVCTLPSRPHRCCNNSVRTELFSEPADLLEHCIPPTNMPVNGSAIPKGFLCKTGLKCTAGVW